MADSSEFVILLDDPREINTSTNSDEFVCLLDDAPHGNSDANARTNFFQLPANSTISVVMALYQDLAELDANGDNGITIDASLVSESDTAALQLLSLFIMCSEGKGRAIAWLQPSVYFSNLALQLDYVKYLKFNSSLDSF